MCLWEPHSLEFQCFISNMDINSLNHDL
jgi:hypothetical protein